MPTTTDIRVNDLIINKMTQEQYDALPEKSPTELYVIEGDSNLIYAEQAVALPTASADNLGKLYQYIGATDANYTQNYFYKCTSAGDPAVYSWTQVDVQPATPVGNATLTIQKNSTTIDTFTANATVDKTINISVPTATSDLTNDSDFASITFRTWGPNE